jgi:hypothetical protein
MDAGPDVVVELPVESGTAAEDLHVSGGADDLVIRSSDAAEAPLLSVVQLYSTVNPGGTRVKVPADGTLRVTLRKLDPDLPWPGLEARNAPQVLSSQHGNRQSRRVSA